ncbi:MAG TPA: MurR/RpiR family transcriptional regulator [Candidatus Krumholzibacteria bacterium]
MTQPKDLENLRTEIVRRYEGLSPRLKQVAKFVLDHPNDVALQTLAVIASRCKVQPSTIVRFAKTFGYAGASDIQKLFRDEILNLAPSSSYSERIRQFSERSGGPARQTPHELMREFADNNILALKHLQEVVRAEDLERALDMIGHANAVYIIGLRRSFPVAAYLAYALRHVDKRAYLIDGVAGMLAEQAGIVEPKDLLIAISFHPYAPETAEIVAASRARGAQVLAISDSRLSPIAREANLYFEIKDAEVRQFRSLTASLCLAQTLVISYAYRVQQRAPREH